MPNVVPDDAVRGALNRAFREAGFSVREARTGRDALRLADEVPALVVLDDCLPDLTGAEVRSRLRDCPGTASTPVLHVAAAQGGPPAAVPDDAAPPALSPERVVASAKALLWARRGEHLFRGFLEAAPDAVALADAAGALVYVNARLEGLFGYGRDELLGRAVEVLVPERFRAAHTGHYRAFFAAPGVRRMGEGMRLVGLRRDGSEFPVDVALSPLATDTGTLVAASIRDVTELRRLEGELRRQAGELEAADRRKDRFLAVLAHELRGPLAALHGVAGVLGSPAAADRREWAAGVVARQTGHMARLVEDLLDVARVRSGKVALRTGPTDLVEVAARAVEICRPAVEGRRHALRVDLPPGPVRVDGDGTRLTQVVANLLGNAARYTPEGGRIALTLAAERGEAVLRVRDTGIGIPADMRDRVFELFTQVEGAGDAGGTAGGLGIGLALVKRLVELHGGTVVVASAGLGSEFTVRLPLLAEAGGPNPPPQAGGA